MQELYNETDAATGGWLSHAASLLAACSVQLPSASIRSSSGGGGSSRGSSGGSPSDSGPLRVTHVAVTSGQLIPSLAKLLLFQLVLHIAPQHVWSSRYEGKQRCFERVRRRFGDACSYLAIGEAAAGGRWAGAAQQSCMPAALLTSMLPVFTHQRLHSHCPPTHACRFPQVME